MTDRNTFPFKIITPEKIVYDDMVTMAVIPGIEGDFGVLAHHSAFASPLRPGAIVIYKGNEKETLTITGGFAEITATSCQVLADMV